MAPLDNSEVRMMNEEGLHPSSRILPRFGKYPVERDLSRQPFVGAGLML
jgi:hypothetical protein